MKALLITPGTKSIEIIEINDHSDIEKVIGFDTIISDEIGPEGDQLYFDEDCFLRGSDGRFQIDTVVPVAGKGVIIGSTDDGKTLKDAVSDIESINSRIKYI